MEISMKWKYNKKQRQRTQVYQIITIKYFWNEKF